MHFGSQSIAQGRLGFCIWCPVLCLIAACSGKTTSRTSVPLDELCDLFVVDLCITLTECAGLDYADLDHCVADRECAGMQDLESEVAAGWLTYDPGVVAACHNEFIADPCNFGFFIFFPSIHDILLTCEEQLIGNQGVGDPCLNQLDCIDGVYCSVMDWTCPGTCEIWLTEGEACESGDGLLCDPDLFCTFSNVCAVRRPPGVQDDPCDSLERCDDGFYCDLATVTCQAQGGVGDTCRSLDSECTGDLWCQYESFPDGTCEPESADGGPCRLNGHCQEGLVCIWGTHFGTCGARSPEGGSCDGNSDCADGLHCDHTNFPDSECAPRLGIGEECIFDPDCSEDLSCEDDLCKRSCYPGDPCDDALSVCIQSLCDGTLCQYRSGLGEPCTENSDCASRECDANVCVDGELCFLE